MTILKKPEITKVIEILAEVYPEAECALVHENTFQLLITVVLSAQTTDKSVNQISPLLFERYPDAEALASARAADLENILKRIGMYRTKAKNIIALSQTLIDEFEGHVPKDYDLLIKLPGVGRKTANVVLSVGFGVPRIAVDTHVFRLANRIGLAAEKNVLDTELALMKAIPENLWIMTHHALIMHGRNVCGAQRPGCDGCALDKLCKKNGVERKK